MTVGAQVLKQQAQPVLQVNDDIRAFAKDMIHAMREYDGIGLAAPQAGRSLRLVVLEVPGSDEEELSPGEAAMLPQMPMVLVNPRIIGRSDSVCERDEGCLSVPGRRGDVLRSQEIVVEYADMTSIRDTSCEDIPMIRDTVRGFTAVIFQHEIDHLEGVLYIDRL